MLRYHQWCSKEASGRAARWRLSRSTARSSSPARESRSRIRALPGEDGHIRGGCPEPCGGPRGAAVNWQPEDRNPALAHLYAAGRVSGFIGDEARLERATRGLRGLPRDTLLAASLAADLQLLRDPLDYQHAQALEREGRLREALGWYAALEMFSVHDLPWAVPALLDRARIHEALGDPAAATELKDRFRRLRAGPDPRPGPDPGRAPGA